MQLHCINKVGTEWQYTVLITPRICKSIVLMMSYLLRRRLSRRTAAPGIVWDIFHFSYGMRRGPLGILLSRYIFHWAPVSPLKTAFCFTIRSLNSSNSKSWSCKSRSMSGNASTVALALLMRFLSLDASKPICWTASGCSLGYMRAITGGIDAIKVGEIVTSSDARRRLKSS